MSYVVAKPGEAFETVLRRFKKAVERAGILADIRKHEYYDKPSIKKRKKREAARKRRLKEEKKLAKFKRKEKPSSNKNFKWNKDKTKKLPLPPPRKRVERNTSFNKPRSNIRTTKGR